MGAVIITSLKSAVISLGEALQEYSRQPNNFIRDACIRRFEYTYVLSCKILRQYIELSSHNPAEAIEMSLQSLIRAGSEKGVLLNGWDVWRIYCQARNAVSHAYNEINAIMVFNEIPKFLVEVEYLCEKLKV